MGNEVMKTKFQGQKDRAMWDELETGAGSDVIEKTQSIQTVKGRKTKKAQEAVWGLSKAEFNLFNPENFPALFGEHDKEPNKREPFAMLTQAKKGVITFLSVDWDKEELKKKGIDIPSWNRLDSFDREVYMAVASLYLEAGNYYVGPKPVLISSRMVFQVLSGNKENQNPTPEILKSISRSIERMSIIRVTIDASQELRARLNIRGEYSDYLLNTKAVRGEINGAFTDCVQVNFTPILYEYASAKNQIARMPVKMLDSPISNTQENIALKGYLARHIASIKSTKSDIGDIVRYDTLYDVMGVRLDGEDEKARNTYKTGRKRARKLIKELLGHWKETGDIKDFEEITEGGMKTKIKITV